MKQLVWLSFDLGVQGDYEGLYLWLDQHDARDCGDSLACFQYETRGNLPQRLLKDIESTVKMPPKTRMYVIWMADGKINGRFIVGRRKSPRWSGFAPSSTAEIDTNE